jgi:predicted Zn-dependent protease
MMIFHTAVILMALALAPVVMAQDMNRKDAANPFAVNHLIPPNYQPSEGKEAKDERGMWLQDKEFERSIRNSGLLVKNESINNYVSDIVCDLSQDYCFDIRVYVIRNPSFNAFMTPTGTMVVYTGLLTRVESKDELAAVIGHELAHYTRMHSIQRVRHARSNRNKALIASFTLGIALGVDAGGASDTASFGSSIANMFSEGGIRSFSRENETEADFLGTRLLEEAGYNPHASYQVWEMMVAEELAVSDAKKSRQTSLWSTHPAPIERAAVLRENITIQYGPAQENSAESINPHVAMLSENYDYLMESQFDTIQFDRLETMLNRHLKNNVSPAKVQFYRGELHRQRNQEDDQIIAREAYMASINSVEPHPGAYRELGYMNLKAGLKDAANENFRQYLAQKPDADDKLMIEFYLQESQ